MSAKSTYRLVGRPKEAGTWFYDVVRSDGQRVGSLSHNHRGEEARLQIGFREWVEIGNLLEFLDEAGTRKNNLVSSAGADLIDQILEARD